MADLARAPDGTDLTEQRFSNQPSFCPGDRAAYDRAGLDSETGFHIQVLVNNAGRIESTEGPVGGRPCLDDANGYLQPKDSQS